MFPVFFLMASQNKGGGERGKKEKNDKNSGHCVIASSWQPERHRPSDTTHTILPEQRPLECSTLVPIICTIVLCGADTSFSEYCNLSDCTETTGIQIRSHSLKIKVGRNNHQKLYYVYWFHYWYKVFRKKGLLVFCSFLSLWSILK